MKDIAGEEAKVAVRAGALMTEAHTPSAHPMWLLDHEKPKKKEG